MLAKETNANPLQVSYLASDQMVCLQIPMNFHIKWFVSKEKSFASGKQSFSSGLQVKKKWFASGLQVVHKPFASGFLAIKPMQILTNWFYSK